MPVNRRTIIFLQILFLILIHTKPASAAEEKWSEKEYSRRECRWAAQWINKELTVMMGSNIIRKIITKNERFEVLAGKSWYKLRFNKQGELLKNLSRARQITGHSPFFKITDTENRQVIALVSEEAIEILFPEEGFFKYIPAEGKKKETYY